MRDDLRQLGTWLDMYKMTTQAQSGQHNALLAVAEKMLILLGKMVAKIETLEEENNDTF